MDIVREVEKVLAIQDSQKKLDIVLGSLEQIFEKGQALQLVPAKLGKAVSLLLAAAMEEQQVELREGLLAASLTAISRNQISTYIDWIMLVEHLPRLSGPCLEDALSMLGWSGRYAFLSILQDYLDAPDLFVQMDALEAMQQIWWDVSGRDPALKEVMQITALAELHTLLINPQKWPVPPRASHARLIYLCDEILGHVRDWLEWNRYSKRTRPPGELREQFARMRARVAIYQKSGLRTNRFNRPLGPPRVLQRQFVRMRVEVVAHQKAWFRTHKHYEF